MRLLWPLGAYLASGVSLYWLVSEFNQRHSAILTKFSSVGESMSPAQVAMMLGEMSELELSAAMVRLVVCLAIAIHIYAVLRVIRANGRPHYMRLKLALGYASIGLLVFNGMFGFYRWYALLPPT